jgi:hypothetical protein
LPVSDGRSGVTFSWPVWEGPASADLVRALLDTPLIVKHEPENHVVKQRGLLAVMRCQRLIGQKNLFFSESVAV